MEIWNDFDDGKAKGYKESDFRYAYDRLNPNDTFIGYPGVLYIQDLINNANATVVTLIQNSRISNNKSSSSTNSSQGSNNSPTDLSINQLVNGDFT